MPVDPRIAADMAERQVGRKLVEPIGCRLGQDHRVAGAHRRFQAGRIIIRRGQTVAANPLDIGEQGRAGQIATAAEAAAAVAAALAPRAARRADPSPAMGAIGSTGFGVGSAACLG